MATKIVTAFGKDIKVHKCDKCGYIWPQAGEKKPVRCSRHGCRSMKWDKLAEAAK